MAQWPDSWDATRAEAREDKQWGSQEIKPGDIQYLRLTGGAATAIHWIGSPTRYCGTCSAAS